MDKSRRKKFCLSKRVEEYHFIEDGGTDESNTDDDCSAIFKMFHQKALKRSRQLEIEEKFNNEIQSRFNNQQLTYDDYSSNLTNNDYSIRPNLTRRSTSKLVTSTPRVNLSALRPINKTLALPQIETAIQTPSIRKTNNNYVINNVEEEYHDYQEPFTNVQTRKSTVNFRRRQSTIPFERVRRLANDSPYMSPLSPDPQKNKRMHKRKSTTIFKSYCEVDTQTSPIEYQQHKSLTINDLNSNNGNKSDSSASVISFSKAFVDEPEDIYLDRSAKKNELKLNEFTTSNRESSRKTRSTNNLNKSINSFSFEPPQQNNKRSTMIPTFDETTTKSTNRINGSRKSIPKNSEIISQFDDPETLSNRKSRSKSLINLSNSTKYQESINSPNKKSTRKSLTNSKLNSEIKSNVKNSEILTNQFEETSGIVSKSNNSTKRSKKSMNTSSELVSGLRNTIKNSEIETLPSNETQEEDNEDEKLNESINNSRKSKRLSRQLSIRKNSSTPKSLKSTLKSSKSIFDQEDVTDEQNSIGLLNESEIESIKPSTSKQNTSIKSSTPYLSSRRISSNASLLNEAVPINNNSAIDSIKNNDTSSIVSNTSKSKNNLINTSLKSTRRSSKTSSEIFTQINGTSEIITQVNNLSEIETSNETNLNDNLTNEKNSEIKTIVSAYDQTNDSNQQDLSAKSTSEEVLANHNNLTNNDKNSEIVNNIVNNSEIISNINELETNDEGSSSEINNISKIDSEIKSNINSTLTTESQSKVNNSNTDLDVLKVRSSNSEIFSNHILELDSSISNLEKESKDISFDNDYELNDDLNSKIMSKESNNDDKYSKLSDDEKEEDEEKSHLNISQDEQSYEEEQESKEIEEEDEESKDNEEENEEEDEESEDNEEEKEDDDESRLDITKDTANESNSELKNSSFSRIEPNFSRISVSFEPSINNNLNENNVNLDNDELPTDDKDENIVDKDNFKIPKIPPLNGKQLKPTTSRQPIVKQPLKFYETMVNKTPTIIYPEQPENEDDQDALVRRSSRIRVRPLEFWRNQKLKYKVDKETKCFTIEGVEKGFKPENPFSKKYIREPQQTNKRKLKESNKKSKFPKKEEEEDESSVEEEDEESENEVSEEEEEDKKPVKRKRYVPNEESIHQDVNESALVTSEKIKKEAAEFYSKSDLVWNPSRQSQGVFIALMNRKKSPKTGTQASGFLKMEPFAEKPRQESSDYVTKYVVMFGAVSVQIGDKPTVFLKGMDSFKVEKHTKYSIRNLRKDEALLYFDVCRSS